MCGGCYLDGVTPAKGDMRRVPRSYLRGGVLSLTGLAIIVGTIVLVQNLTLKSPHTHASIPPQEKPALPLPSIPSIAVLPFTNLSGDPQQDYFSDGIADDLVTDLSRLPGLFVIDRNSTFTYKGKPTRVQEVGRQLGVKYVLEGSARKVANQVRIDVQLVDASTGNQVWAQRYDKQFRDIFKLQDEIVQSLIATLNLQLPLLEKGYVVPQRTNNPEAYNYFLRGLEDSINATSQEGFTKASTMFEKAIEQDPGYADAYAFLGLMGWTSYGWQWDKSPRAIDRVAELANKSITLDDSEAVAYALRGWTDLAKGQPDRAIVDGERAVSLAPNSAFGYLALATIYNQLGARNSKEALAYAQKAERLDPRHPEYYAEPQGIAYNDEGQYAKAIEVLKQGQPTNPWIHLALCFSYSELGREPEARTEAAEVMRVSPQFSLEPIEPKKGTVIDPTDQRLTQLFFADLRKAGLK
jgi:adenylate cyclase